MSSKPRVRVSRETWKELNAKKEPGDTLDDVLDRLLEEHAHLLKELEEASEETESTDN